MHGEGHGFLWLTSLPGLHHAPVHVITALFVALGLALCAFVVRGQLVRAQTGGSALIPESRLSFRNFFEIVAEQLYRFVVMILGEEKAPLYYPLVGTLFIFIFFSNLIGMIPGFLPPTDNLNTTLAMGAFVFVYYNYVGFKEHGMSYLKQFMGPVWWMAWLLIPIELISHCVRPFTLGLRLRGNMVGDHMVLTIFLEKTPYLVPVIFYGFGLFVCFVQAFVFCLLTMIDIMLATSHDH